MARHLLLAIAALGLGCTVEPLTREGFLCEEGTCPQGYSCDPRDNLCVTEGSPCDGVLRRSPCNPDASDCAVHGCRVCEGDIWSACIVFRDECAPDSSWCDGSERWVCDGSGHVAERVNCGSFGCNEQGGAHCNECRPSTVRCEGMTRIDCDAQGRPSAEDCSIGADSQCRGRRCDVQQGCVDAGDLPLGTSCNDGYGADGTFCDSRCDGNGTCVPGVARCDDGNACTEDACEPTVGCIFQSADAGTACGNLCSKSCDGHGICAAGDVDCDDGNPCTDDACEPYTGCVYAPADGVPCEDGNACTTPDICAAGVCVSGATDCTDDDPCTVDLCGVDCEHVPVSCFPTLPTDGDCSVSTSCNPTGPPGNCDAIATGKDGTACTDCTRPPCTSCLAGTCQSASRCDGTEAATACETAAGCAGAECQPAECHVAVCDAGHCRDDAFAPYRTPCDSCPGRDTVGCVCEAGACVDDAGVALIAVSNMPAGFNPCMNTTTDYVFSTTTIDTGPNGGAAATIGGSPLPANSQVVQQGAGLPEIAVFYFNAIHLPITATVTVVGERALALVACTTLSINGQLFANGQDGGNGSGGTAGPGGWAGGREGGCSSGCDGQAGAGPFAGQPGQYNGRDASEAGGGGGGAHAGDGGNGGYGEDSGAANRGLGGDGPSPTNWDLVPLSGGSGGGAGGNGEGGGTHDARGGGGGGAIQLSANQAIVLGADADIRANGGRGADAGDKHGAGGGGAGGGVLIEAPDVTDLFYSSITVHGGDGGKNQTVHRADGARFGAADGETGRTNTWGGNGGGGGGGHIYVNEHPDNYFAYFGDRSPWVFPCFFYDGSVAYQP